MKTIIDIYGRVPIENCCGGTPALVRLLGRELIGYSLERLKKCGIESAYVCADHDLSEISDYCGNCGIMPLTVTDPELLKVKEEQEDILLLGGEYYYSAALSELAQADGPAVLVCSEPVGCDPICFIGSDGVISDISTENSELCFAGAIYLPSSFAHYYSGGTAETLVKLFKDGALLRPIQAHYSVRVTGTRELLGLQRHLLDNAGALSLPDIGRHIYTEGSVPPAGVKIIPPVYIGNDVTLAHGAEIGPYSSIDEGALIERKAAVHGSYIGCKSVIGAHTAVSGGAVFANARFGNAVKVGEGAAVGRGAAVYSNAVICSGVSIYAGRKVFEGAYVCDDLTRSSISSRTIDDDCCCSLGADPSPADILRFGAAIGSALPLDTTVAVCHIGTPTAADICSCLRMGLSSAGCRVLEIGAGTRQLLAFALSRCKLPLGCFVSSGSEDNISLISTGGLPLSADIERKIVRGYSVGGTRYVPMPDQSTSAAFSGIRLLYEDWLRAVLPKNGRVRASLRCPNRQLMLLADSIFKGFDEGSGEHIVFHISNDGSACSAYTADAGYIEHDKLLLLAFINAMRCQVPAALPYAFTASADTIAAEEDGTLLRYLTVTDGEEDREARECAARIDNLYVRDGIALAAMITMLIEKDGRPFSEIVAELPEIHNTQRYVGTVGKVKDLAEGIGAEKVGFGAELVREDGRAVVRPVKGSRGLMVFAESFSAEAAMSLCDELTERLKELSKKTT